MRLAFEETGDSSRGNACLGKRLDRTRRWREPHTSCRQCGVESFVAQRCSFAGADWSRWHVRVSKSAPGFVHGVHDSAGSRGFCAYNSSKHGCDWGRACRSSRGDRPPLGRRRRPGPFFLYPPANARHVANDQAANRWDLSGAAASGRVPRGRAMGSPCGIYPQIDRVRRR